MDEALACCACGLGLTPVTSISKLRVAFIQMFSLISKFEGIKMDPDTI